MSCLRALIRSFKRIIIPFSHTLFKLSKGQRVVRASACYIWFFNSVIFVAMVMLGAWADFTSGSLLTFLYCAEHIPCVFIPIIILRHR